MSVSPELPAAWPRLAAELADPASLSAQLAQPGTLAVFGFGAAAARAGEADPRYLPVPLQPLDAPRIEVWRVAGPVARARDDGIAHADDGQLQFGALELDETAAGGILGASAAAYARLQAFRQRSGFPHLLRVWNYFDAITEGEGDGERSRQFCVGRVRGLGAVDTASLPAATAIGSHGDARQLQVYWLAARRPGTPLENPRQTSAWRYPRDYGPQSPSFARAMLPAPGAALPLLLSGTASIVGHASRHVESLAAQLDETLANLHSLLGAAHARLPALAPRFDASSRLKVYVRDADDADAVARLLDLRLGSDVPRLLLQADVCRRELRVEIEGLHGVIMDARHQGGGAWA